MSKKNKPGRRTLLARAAAVLGGAVVVSRHSHAAMTQTPRATEGPFYPTPPMRVPDTDNDLVKIEGEVTEAGGEIITLKGVVSDSDGNSLSNIRVEIWQCDVNGKYLHAGDSQGISHDRAFQGFGHDITNESGEYSFRTIKPAKYAGRAPHIHVKVLADDAELLTSQFYLEGDSDNQRDGIFRRLSAEQAAAVSMRLVESNGQAEAVINIVV